MLSVCVSFRLFLVGVGLIKIGEKVRPTYGSSNLLVIRIFKKVDHLELSGILGLLVKIATYAAGDVTHNVEFGLGFLVYKFTAIHFAQGMSVVISALKNRRKCL